MRRIGPQKNKGVALMHKRSTVVAAAVTVLALTTGVNAQEFCVTCSGPTAAYRCLIGGENTNAAARSSRGQFLCITELAKAGGHASCSATRGQSTSCPGETRTVMFSLADPGAAPLATTSPPPLVPVPSSTTPLPPGHDLPPVALPPPQAQPAQPTPPVETGTAPPANEKPNAVEDLANKTGKAVGNAVKKSWDCVASLFGDC
jgi:hypothetical protein